MTKEFGNCECGASLMDAGPLGVNCSNINCPVEKTIVQQVAKAFQDRRELPPSNEHAFTFTNVNQEPFLILHSDGRITVGPHVTADEAAQRFLDSLRENFPAWLSNLRSAHEPLSGDALLKHLEGQCQAVWRTSFTIVCALPKGHDGDHRADCGYTFNGEVDVRAAQPPPAEWQPIDTAPKDGTVLLAYRHQLGSLSWIVIMFDRTNGIWFNYYTGQQEFPTHWQALTSPLTKESGL